jgi:hypothetical protein
LLDKKKVLSSPTFFLDFVFKGEEDSIYHLPLDCLYPLARINTAYFFRIKGVPRTFQSVHYLTNTIYLIYIERYS